MRKYLYVAIFLMCPSLIAADLTDYQVNLLNKEFVPWYKTFGTNLDALLNYEFDGVDYDFPDADGSNGYQLTTNGSGTLTWADADGGDGSTTQLISLGYVSATEITCPPPAAPLICVGLAGVAEIGSTEGYVTLAEAADFLRFHIQLPETFVDGGTANDLQIEFDIHEQDVGEGNYDVKIYEYGNTTEILSDTITISNGVARAWDTLDNYTSGIGADTDIGASDCFVIEFTANTDEDDVNIYGCRITYTVGIQNES